MLDRLFLIFFARYRRERGERDIQKAWDRPIYRMSTLGGLAIVLVVLALVFAWTLPIGWGSTGDHKTVARGAAMVGVIAGICGMRLRFRKFLVRPVPALPAAESREDRRIALTFQAGTIALLVILGASGYVLHEMGFRVV